MRENHEEADDEAEASRETIVSKVTRQAQEMVMANGQCKTCRVVSSKNE
jgi:hypothetical protein